MDGILEYMKKGANVSFYDPYAKTFQYKEATIQRKELAEELAEDLIHMGDKIL